MHLGFHGGKCCGIKVIYGFYDKPDVMLESLPKIKANNGDQYGESVYSDTRFFHEEAPEETATSRLDRYIEYCLKRRPSGIIEITLADSVVFNQVAVWGNILRKRGFRCVTKAFNSNSGNIVHVYHKVYGQPEK